jgi:iron(III) transport system substrate-binding protein
MWRFGLLNSFLLSILLAFFSAGHAFSAEASPNSLKTSKDAKAKGYAYILSRDEIVTKAKQEGRLRALAEMDSPHIKASTQAFMKKYPFIDLYIQEITGTDAARRNILELKSGAGKDWDILHLSTDFYSEYIPHVWRVDIRGMSEQGILHLPTPMIDPKHRNVVSFFSRFQVTAYNTELVPANQLPKSWDDLLKAEFQGRKFALDIRPTEIAALVPAWGLEKTLDFARKMARQQPLWIRGGTRTLTAMIAGEVPMFVGPNFNNVKAAQRKDAKGVLQYVILEPVPLRLALPQGIRADAPHPHAALLWLEWMASPEAQKIIDEYEPLASSVYVGGGAVEQELRGKKLSVVSWDHHQNMEEWQAKVFEAYGFPKAELKK